MFGAGYPSLPTMSVDDWYEQHRKKNALPDQGIPRSTGRGKRDVHNYFLFTVNCMYIHCFGENSNCHDPCFFPPFLIHQIQFVPHSEDVDAEEREQEEKEKRVENDDEEALQKARDWDNWKDTHRRGYGNRKNMG